MLTWRTRNCYRAGYWADFIVDALRYGSFSTPSLLSCHSKILSFLPRPTQNVTGLCFPWLPPQSPTCDSLHCVLMALSFLLISGSNSNYRSDDMIMHPEGNQTIGKRGKKVYQWTLRKLHVTPLSPRNNAISFINLTSVLLCIDFSEFCQIKICFSNYPML